MRHTLTLLALLLASPVLADDPTAAIPLRRPATIQRREATQAAREQAASEQRQQAAADRARIAAYNKFLTTGILPADPTEAQNILRMHDLRMRQAELQAKARAAAPRGHWVQCFVPGQGSFWKWETEEERKGLLEQERTRQIEASQRPSAFGRATVRPNPFPGGGYDIEFVNP